MRIQLAMVFAAMALTAQSAVAQRPRERERPREGEQRAQEQRRQHPAPPAPVRRRPTARPDIEHRRDGRNDDRPHVTGRRWYGHAPPNDVRFRVSRPFEHGRFRELGPRYRYHVVRFDRDRHVFWLPSGVYFEIAPWDYDLASDWCWDCADDDIVVYRDPDHFGWYLIYDSRNGVYLHAQYMGR
jgi:hypothetical protein